MYLTLNTSQAIIDFNLVGTFGFRLRMIRELVEMSRPKFADLLQTPPTTLKNYEMGYRKCGLETVVSALWHQSLHELANAMFVQTPPFYRVKGDNGPEYEMKGMDGSITRMTRAGAATMLRTIIMEAAKRAGIRIPSYFEQRWTDNGL